MAVKNRSLHFLSTNRTKISCELWFAICSDVFWNSDSCWFCLKFVWTIQKMRPILGKNRCFPHSVTFMLPVDSWKVARHTRIPEVGLFPYVFFRKLKPHDPVLFITSCQYLSASARILPIDEFRNVPPVYALGDLPVWICGLFRQSEALSLRSESGFRGRRVWLCSCFTKWPSN